MSRYTLTRSASYDLYEIVDYLAEHAGDTVAHRIENTLLAGFESISQNPSLGHRRQDLTPLPLHFFTVDPYLIVYQRDTAPVVIHAIFHGARDVKRHLKGRNV